MTDEPERDELTLDEEQLADLDAPDADAVQGGSIKCVCGDASYRY